MTTDGFEVKKSIGILLPCYNEEENVEAIAKEISALFKSRLRNYNFTIVFIDNASTDATRDKLETLCKDMPFVRAIFNARNFSYASTWHGISNTPGDCVIAIPSDFQVPIDVIPPLIEKWELGCDVVALVKTQTEERGIKRYIRKLYYKFSGWLSESETLPNFSGALYDRRFLDLCRSLDDPLMYVSLRATVCALATNLGIVNYKQANRRHGKSKNNYFSLFQIALSRFTETSSIFPVVLFVVGLGAVLLSFIFLIIFVVLKLASVIASGLFFGGLLSFVIFLLGFTLVGMGVLGQYLMKVHMRLMRRPSVIERTRINYDETD